MKKFKTTPKLLKPMKHSIIKGILHDFSNHLGLLLWYDKLEGFPSYKKTNVLEKKDKFEEYCVSFLFERLPDDFDFSRITKFLIETQKTDKNIHLKFEVNLDKQTIQYKTIYKK